MSKTVTRATPRDMIGNGRKPLLVEALPASYFRQEHLSGAVAISHDAIEALAPAILPEKNAEIVVYCASATCNNSNLAAQRLAAPGYAKVAVCPGDKADWQAHGLPLERGVPAAAAV